jgi:N-formylglutamate amidohydrolase
VNATFDSHNTGDHIRAHKCVCLSVPHAGRDYPDWVASALNVPLAKTRSLEDRYADVLVGEAVSRGYPTLVARTPRLVIDLNRAETDFDPAIVGGPCMMIARPSARARGGLGLVPDRLGTIGRLWKGRLSASDLAARIATSHRPYHRALGDALAVAGGQHGIAVLLDVHSMPSLPGHGAADVVIGDLWGRAADPALAAVAKDLFTAQGLRVDHNVPYAGGHILERHARPKDGVHGMQIEIDRRLYLDSKLDLPGTGLTRVATMIADLADALSETAVAMRSWPIAAE